MAELCGCAHSLAGALRSELLPIRDSYLQLVLNRPRACPYMWGVGAHVGSWSPPNWDLTDDSPIDRQAPYLGCQGLKPILRALHEDVRAQTPSQPDWIGPAMSSKVTSPERESSPQSSRADYHPEQCGLLGRPAPNAPAETSRPIRSRLRL